MNGIPSNALTSTPDRSEIESANCTICQNDDCNPAPLMTTTVCNHTFHKICLDNWLKVSNTCPMCRADLPNRAVDPIEQVTRHVESRLHRELDNVPVPMMRRTHVSPYEQTLRRTYKQTLRRACEVTLRRAYMGTLRRTYEGNLRRTYEETLRRTYEGTLRRTYLSSCRLTQQMPLIRSERRQYSVDNGPENLLLPHNLTTGSADGPTVPTAGGLAVGNPQLGKPEAKPR